MAEATIQQLMKVFEKKNQFIEDYLSGFDKQLSRIERELLEKILADYVTRFAYSDNGELKLTERNAIAMRTELDKVFADLKKNFTESVFKETGQKMLALTAYSTEYFRKQNFSAKTLSSITDKLKVMQQMVGIDSKGKVIEGSFIDRLASLEQVKDELSDYTRKSLQGGVSSQDFANGFKDMIKGKEGVNGAVSKYVSSFVHDSVWTHSQTIDNFFAGELGLQYFLYMGDKIKTTREFCEARYGKYFKRSDGEAWNGEDWQGKIPDIDFFVQRGGYNCRHTIRWVSKTYYDRQQKIN